MARQRVGLAPAVGANIPFRQFLVGLRASNVNKITEALRRADADQIADALKDRDSQHIVNALRLGAIDTIVDALLTCDEAKLDALKRGRESKKIADAMLGRNAKNLTFALRGRDPDRILLAVRDGNVDQIVAALRDRGVGRRGDPLPIAVAEALLKAIPEEDGAIQRITDALCALDPMHVLPPLSPDEAGQIVVALEKLPREEIINVLLERHRAIWDQIFHAVMPRVTLVMKLRFSEIPELVSEDAVASLAQSMARTLISRAEKGKLQEYDLDSVADLTGLLITIAWRKGCKRLKEIHCISLSQLPIGPDDSINGGWEPSDPTTGAEEELIEKEMLERFDAVLDKVWSTLECIDRVILENKLKEPPVTNEEIAQLVVEHCAGWEECAVRTITRHWNAIKQSLRRLLQTDLDDSSRQSDGE